MLVFSQFLVLSLAFVTVIAETGEATYYSPGLGACGFRNTSSDLIIAVAEQYYNTYPGATANTNNNPICNRKVMIKYGGKSVIATIVDKCPSCKGKYDLDLSPATFDKLENRAVGRIENVYWEIFEGKSNRANVEPKINMAKREFFVAKEVPLGHKTDGRNRLQ